MNERERGSGDPPGEGHVTDLLPDYVRGELPDDAAGSVSAHLSECPECRADEGAVRALAASPLEGLRPADRERVLGGLERSGWRESARRGPASGRSGARLAWRAAAVVALVGGAAAVWRLAGAGSDDARTWSPAAAVAAWRSDLEQVGARPGEALLALGLAPGAGAGAAAEGVWDGGVSDPLAWPPDPLPWRAVEEDDLDRIFGPWEER